MTVRPDKISESISQQIRDAIFAGLLEPGDKLPTERELIHSFGVSKASMREALRSLEVSDSFRSARALQAARS